MNNFKKYFASMSQRSKIVVYGVTVMFILFAIVMFVRPFPNNIESSFAVGVQSVTAIFAAFFIYKKAYSYGDKQVQKSLLFIGSGVLATAIAGAVITVFYAIGISNHQLTNNTVDTIYAISIPLIVIGFLLFPVSPKIVGSKLSSLLDGLLVAASVWMAVYVIWIAPLGAGGSNYIIESLAYLAGSVFIIGVALSVLGRSNQQHQTLLRVLILAMAFWALSNLIHLVGGVTTGTSDVAGWVAVLSEVGILVLCGIGLVSQGKVAPGEEKNRPFPSTAFSVIPFILITLAWVLTSAFVFGGKPLSDIGRVLTLVIVDLLIIRLISSWLDYNRLTIRLADSDKLYKALTVNAEDVMFVLSTQGELLYESPSLSQIFKQEDFNANDVFSWVHSDDREMMRQTFAQVLAEGNDAKITFTARTLNDSGEWRWSKVTMHNRCNDYAIRGVVVNSHDIHHNVELAKKLQYSSTHDNLTRLGNEDHMRNMLEENSSGSLLLIDIKDFRKVNDTFGKDVGDEVLKITAIRLKTCVREYDTVCRIQSNEYAILLKSTIEHLAERIADRIITEVNVPSVISGNNVIVEAAIGITKVDSRSWDELSVEARSALNTAKENNTGAWKMFPEETSSAVDVTVAQSEQ